MSSCEIFWKTADNDLLFLKKLRKSFKYILIIFGVIIGIFRFFYVSRKITILSNVIKSKK